uniref:Fe2OG dioxygenase domain-containing protein n=1 Tax=Alexandrium catenella TaxID=2925 RepID=A0A7S1SFX7_ALECA
MSSAAGRGGEDARLAEAAGALLKRGQDGEDALAAALAQQEQEVPQGLIITKVDLALVEAAREEVEQLAEQDSSCYTGFELGAWYSDYKVANEIDDQRFVRIKALLKACQSALGHAADYAIVDGRARGTRLNVIIRIYDKDRGGNIGISFHKDHGCFHEQVYGVILQNEGTKGLEYQHEDGCGRKFVMREEPGTTFLKTGESRTAWQHGGTFDNGRRISVTWRWYAAYEPWMET